MIDTKDNGDGGGDGGLVSRRPGRDGVRRDPYSEELLDDGGAVVPCVSISRNSVSKPGQSITSGEEE